MCPGPWARNWQGMRNTQHSHRYGYAEIFNAGLPKIAKKGPIIGEKIKSDSSTSKNDFWLDNSVS